MEDIRLWLYSENEHEADQNLEARCKRISQPKTDDAENKAEGEQAPSEDVELNSGIEFPGQTLEPLLNSALRMNQINFSNNQQIVVEFKQ